jgi:hypothetical protein
MLRRIGCEAGDATGLVVILEKYGCPAIGRLPNKILGSCYRTLKLRESPVTRCRLKLVGTLSNIYNVLKIES